MAAAVLDANVILRHLLHDHPVLSEQADAVFELIRAGELDVLIPESVIAECVFVLGKLPNVDRKMIGGLLGSLLSHRGIIGRHISTLEKALVIFVESRVSFVDAIVIATAEADGLMIKSFDADLNKLASRRAESR